MTHYVSHYEHAFREHARTSGHHASQELAAGGKNGRASGARSRHRPHCSREAEEKPVKWPDFAARRKKIFGDRILPGADIVIEERGRY